MLRRFGARRGELAQPAAATAGAASATPEPEAVVSETGLTNAAAQAEGAGESRASGRGWFSWKRLILASLALMFLVAGAAYTQKDQITPKAANLSRALIGDERTARVEGWFFSLEDRSNKLKYRVLGGAEDPFEVREIQVQFVPREAPREVTFFVGTTRHIGQSLTAEALGPLPLTPPKTMLIQSSPQPGEGVWTPQGLPRSTPADTMMTKTFIRPDKSRPYASVGILLVDSRRVHLKMVGGTAEPGGDRGVRGPGIIPKEDYKTLLVAFNGGFKGPHGGFGMVANGKEYMKMRNGLATVCVAKDGSIKLGEFGRDFSWEESFEACRQNAVLLVDHGEVSKRTTEGNDTWGYVNVNSSEFITWRSAVGVTKDGNLLIASGNSLSADSLARALHAAGAYMALQLDINGPYICTGLFYPQPDGSLKAEKFMDSMAPSASNFLGTRERDFFYLTFDETRYR
ncbi:MAG: phosphodiester glycosidase family protein [Dehalococcoidia bacterium]|nr:phosphodiester glycosidase family protein [Dehalococcoidia bacterium]